MPARWRRKSPGPRSSRSDTPWPRRALYLNFRASRPKRRRGSKPGAARAAARRLGSNPFAPRAPAKFQQVPGARGKGVSWVQGGRRVGKTQPWGPSRGWEVGCQRTPGAEAMQESEDVEAAAGVKPQLAGGFLLGERGAGRRGGRSEGGSARPGMELQSGASERGRAGLDGAITFSPSLTPSDPQLAASVPPPRTT